MDSKIRSYERDGATVTWDQRRCIHVAACVHARPDVFDPDRRPWIEPEHATPDALLDVVTQCPTGALHLRLGGGLDPEAVPDANRAEVAPDGPLFLRGDVTLQTPGGEVLLRDTRVALCRCGLSGNKPLCDNSHLDAFADDGTLPSARSGRAPEADGVTAEAGGPLTVTVATNGPLRIQGPLTVVGAGGAAEAMESVALCRCGASGRKPYCDGSHKRIGFEAA